MLTWRLTNAASPAGPNFQSEREVALAGPNGARPRRQSILESDVAPSELIAANAAGPNAPIPSGRPRARTNSTATAGVVGPDGTLLNGAAPQETESQNARAVEVLERVQQKLTGRDFKENEELDVLNQVNKLIIEATKLENLCQHYIGWCSFW